MHTAIERNILGELRIYEGMNMKPNYSALQRKYGIDRHTIKKYYVNDGIKYKERKEKECLNPIPSKILLESYISNVKTQTVTPTLLVSYKGNGYSVAKSYIGKRVKLIPITNKLYINFNTELITIHDISLNKFVEHLDNYIEYINSGFKTIIDALYELSEYECTMRVERAMNACVKVANFLFLKTFEDFNFNFQPSINKEQILN